MQIGHAPTITHSCAMPLPLPQHGSHLTRVRGAQGRWAIALSSRPAVAQPETSRTVTQQRGLVLPVGSPGSWDEAGVGSPVVRCYVGDNEERWFMWYGGRAAGAPSVDLVSPSSGSTGIAVSKDGIAWQRGGQAVAGERGALAQADVGACLTPNGDWWTFDTCHLAVSDVQVLSNSSVQAGVGVYWGFYSGGDFEAVRLPERLLALGGQQGKSGPGAQGAEVPGLRLRAGLAMSQDARNWARIEGEHHTGALLDVGAEGEWDQLFIGHPQVLSVGPRDMRMFYHSWDERLGRFIVGYASSPDGFRWTKKGPVYDTRTAGAAPGDFDELGACARHVVRDPDNRQFLMFYEAVAASGQRSIGLAVSKDGSSWSRYPVPVLTPSPSPSPHAESGHGSQLQGTEQQPGLQAAQQPEGAPSSRGSAAQGVGAGGAVSEGAGQQAGQAGAWDAGAVGAPCAVSMSGGRWRLYYAGRAEAAAGPWLGVGLALSDQGGPTFQGVPCTFSRWTHAG
ncbi:hypothetical protein QJQ45_022078 [Haematococcus lacustris]|nr:hypothetical protein QJQ45_022078 [Haematococcus lacustris]